MQKPRQNKNARKLTYEISKAASLTCLIRIFSNMSKDALWSTTPFWCRSRLFMADFMVWVCEARFTRLRVGRGVTEKWGCSEVMMEVCCLDGGGGRCVGKTKTVGTRTENLLRLWVFGGWCSSAMEFSDGWIVNWREEISRKKKDFLLLFIYWVFQLFFFSFKSFSPPLDNMWVGLLYTSGEREYVSFPFFFLLLLLECVERERVFLILFIFRFF